MIRHHVRSYGSHKIAAIKLVRELTALGLKDAKDAVEQKIGFVVRAGPDTIARVIDQARTYGIAFDPPLDRATAAAPAPIGTVEPIDTSPGGWAVRYGHGPKKIHAIKLVRELTALGLRDAKELVEQAGVVRAGISREEAEAIAARFAEIASTVEITNAGGFGGPRHPVYEPPSWSPYDDNDEDDDF